MSRSDEGPGLTREDAGTRPARAWRHTAIVLGAAALLYLPGLGGIDLWAPDEPRFAQVAEELRSMRHGPEGLVVLHLGGEVYTQKPPLYYWVVAALGSLSATPGVDEVAARLPSAAAGIGAACLTLVLGRRLFGAGSSAGLWGALVLVTVFRFAHLARRAQLDVILTLFEAVALLAFVALEQRPAGASRTRWLAVLHAALGLALLTKGPVGLLPLAVIASFLLWEGRGREFARFVPLWGLALSLGPALAWVATAVAWTPAGYFGDAIVDNVLLRFLSGTSHIRPFYYYGYQLPLDFLPWTLIWPLAGAAAIAGLRGPAQSRGAWRLLTAWVAVPLVFFSISAGKRGLYLLPAFPAIALVCGAALAKLARTRDPRTGPVLAGLAALGCAGGLAIAIFGGEDLRPGFGVPRALGGALIAFPLAGLLFGRGRSTHAQLGAAVAALLAIELVLFVGLYPRFDAQKSPRPVAVAAARSAPEGEPLGVFENGALVGGIAFYSGRHVVDVQGPEGVERFLSDGGGTFIVRSRDVSRLADLTPVEALERLREGRRALEVVRAIRNPRPDSGSDSSPGQRLRQNP